MIPISNKEKIHNLVVKRILFRAKAKEDFETSHITIEKGEWVYGHYAFCYDEHMIICRLSAECGGVGSGLVDCLVPVDPETLGQFIGLSDKNQIRAYEGDRARYKDQSGKEQIGVITYQDYQYVLIAIGGDDEGNQDIDLHPDEELEIIGNIHDKEKEEKE